MVDPHQLIAGFRRLTIDARLPESAYPDDVGYDVYSNENATIPGNSNVTLSTGVCITDLPPKCYIRIASRSGMSSKHSIEVGAGVVDLKYTGELKVVLYNHHKEDSYTVNKGDRIAQLIFERYEKPLISDMTGYSESNDQNICRGSNGFGSSGN